MIEHGGAEQRVELEVAAPVVRVGPLGESMLEQEFTLNAEVGSGSSGSVTRAEADIRPGNTIQCWPHPPREFSLTRSPFVSDCGRLEPGWLLAEGHGGMAGQGQAMSLGDSSQPSQNLSTYGLHCSLLCPHR